MRKVKTPDGKMHVAGSFRSYFALFIDILAISLVLMMMSGLLYRMGIEIPESAGWIMGVMVFIYGTLTLTHNVPSLGNWALALHKYSYDSIEGYVGKGTLRVTENLTFGTLAWRLVTAIVILGGLFLGFVFI